MEMYNLRKTSTSENEELITEAHRIIDLRYMWNGVHLFIEMGVRKTSALEN